ncbi:unnamed protein product (macronuclear) [Paramecium tetraurelia]|uniref:C2 domain-containing protein n=1 Tax=Paramecium tetraurelia TaxID=5888 RepID=A0D5Z7_PARTE|nr:uncharacterized protein GSPATT00013894001 [Paramecium tetraurelia]CAK78464.1 unnamed protein product [Paramecium tetraurelia]|eukprot:XP_001445861.1 hypothetical protein (macronuclear) [Paramecium tetraurelia strain d4-2]
MDPAPSFRNNSDQQMRDVLQLNQKHQLRSYNEDVAMIQQAKDAITSSVHMNNLLKDRKDQYDIVLTQRKYLWKQEEQVYNEIDQLRDSHRRYQESVNRYGIRNNNLEAEIQSKFEQVNSKLNFIQEEKKQVTKNFNLIQQSLVNSKSKLSSNGQFVIESNQQYDKLVDFIHKQEQKVKYLKNDQTNLAINQLIPFDSKLQQMAQDTYEKQQKYVYQGTKFQGNELQKIAAFSTLRKKIEQHVQKKGFQEVILDLPFKLDEKYQKENTKAIAYDSTLQELDEFRNDYIAKGGNDPKFLKEINELERQYKENHPLGIFDANNQLSHPKSQDQVSQNPIFTYLPQQYQKDILDLEFKLQEQKEADLKNPQMNKQLLRSQLNVSDSSKVDEIILENLRFEESELLLKSKNNEYYKLKYNEIQKLKQIHERNYLEKKVQEQLALRQIEDDMLNFKEKGQTKLTYLQQLQQGIGTRPLFYDQDTGFVVRIDFVNKLPICYDFVKVGYGIFIKNVDEPKVIMNTNQHECVNENIYSKKCVIQEKFVERNHEIFRDTYLYIVLWCFSQDFGSGMVPIQVGWSIHKLFDEEKLMSGGYLLPIYNSSFTFELQRLPEVQEIKIGLRICLPGDQNLDLDNKIMSLMDYKVQPVHLKKPELIDQERQNVFREYKIIPLPEEYIQVRTNDTKLWQSELPPNVYKLIDYNFMNEEEVALKQQEQEYEERRMNRLNRPKRRFMGKQGTIARGSSEKKKTMLTFKQRLALKKGAVTPASTKAKPTEKEQSSRPQSKADISRKKLEESTTTRVQEKQKSALIPSKPRKLMFKLRSLSQIYVGGITTLTMKLALFQGIQLLDDDDKNMCVFSKELEPDEKGDNYINFNESFTFELNLTQYFEDYEESEILSTFLFIAIFKEVTNLFGWHAIQAFDTSDEHFKVKSGIYYENLYGPPGQAPPFNFNKAKRLNTQINFIMMQDDDRVLQLPTIDNYKLDQKLLTEEDKEKRKKIYSVANPKWNTQIRLDISSFRNFQSKDEFIMKTIVIEEENIIIDAIDRQCIKFDQVQLFEGTGKGEFIANHLIILRIGTRYLVDTFTTTFKKLNYLFSFFIKQQIVGVCKFPLFSAGGALNVGSQRLMVHDLDDSGKIGKKTTKEMYIFIQEEQLNLKDIEETPKYAQQTKEQKIVNKQDQSKYLIIEIDQLTDYLSQEPIDFTIQVYNGEEPAMDSDGVICAYTSVTPFQPKPNYSVPINEAVYFKMPINAIIERKQGLENYQVFISFSDLGWISFQLFLNGELNSSDFVGKLFRGDVPAPPVDYTNMKKINTKVSYNVKYDLKQTEEFRNSQVEERSGLMRSETQKNLQSIPSEQTAKIPSRRTMNSNENLDKLQIMLINVNGFINQKKLQVKGILMMEGKTLLDKYNQSCSFKSEFIDNVKKVAFFNNARFTFSVDIPTLQMESYLFLSIFDEKETVIAWFGKRLVQAVGKLNRGQQFEYLFAPPLMRPPLDHSQIQNLQQSIQFEVK